MDKDRIEYKSNPYIDNYRNMDKDLLRKLAKEYEVKLKDSVNKPIIHEIVEKKLNAIRVAIVS